MAWACSRNNSTAIGSGEKNAQRLNRCSASGVSSAVDIVQVAETDAGNLRELLAEQPVGVLREPGEVVVDALAGLGQVGGGVLDGDGQMTQRLGQPSRLADPPLVLVRGEPPVHAEGRVPGGAGS